MFWQFVGSAMRLRARRLSLAFVALGVAAALATALFSIYSDVERRVSDEFASYGANLIIASRGATPSVPVHAAQRARDWGATAAAPFLFTTGTLNGETVSVARVDLNAARELTAFWHVEGSRGDRMIGTNLAQRLHVKVGDVAGIVTTGGAEDNELILPFGTGTLASVVQVRAPAAQLNKVEAALHREFPNVDIRQVQAAAATERSVVTKIRVTLFLLLALILAITTMSVTSNFSELVMERRGEIGILKAIGAGEPITPVSPRQRGFRRIRLADADAATLTGRHSTCHRTLDGHLIAHEVKDAVHSAYVRTKR